MALPTAQEIISREIRERVEIVTTQLEEKKQAYISAQGDLEVALRQLQCDISGTHDFENKGGFLLVDEVCRKCGWTHTV